LKYDSNIRNILSSDTPNKMLNIKQSRLLQNLLLLGSEIFDRLILLIAYNGKASSILKLVTIICIANLMSFGQASAQNHNRVTGTVVDSISMPISDANIALISGSDTLKTRSDRNGAFLFFIKETGHFQLKISHIGFAEFNNTFSLATNSDSVNLKPIKLSIYATQLKEVLIKATRKPILFKKDTIEYDVDSFNMNDDDLVEYLLKKLPGLNLDKEGNLTSEGKKVTKLRVNGQDFFSGNIKEFIKKLPVGILSKIQIINDYGDDAAFSGIKTKPIQKMLNLVTKPDEDNGIFGNVSSTAGTNKLIGADINGNYWKGVKQISGDVNLQNATSAVGSSVNNKADLSYSNQIGKYLKIGGNYNFGNSRTSNETNTFSETINSLGTIKNQINGKSFAKNTTHSFSLNASYNPDEKVEIKLNANLNLNNSTDSTFSDSRQTGLFNQSLISSDYGNSKNPTGNINVQIGRRFNKAGRVIMANVEYKNSNNKAANAINRRIRYYDTLGNFKKDSTFNSLTTNRLKVMSTNITLSYTEPLNSKSNLDFVYKFSGSKQNTSLITEESLPQGLFRIDSLSNHYDNYTSNQKLDINYRFEGEKINLVSGLSLQRNTLSGFTANTVTKVQQSIYNFSPALNLTYNPNSAMSLDLNYSGESEAPAIDELQPVQNIKDIQNIFIGNPRLKPAFTHQAELNFRHFSDKSNQLITAGLSASLTQNKIVNNTVIITDTLNSLKQLTSFVNANGSYRLGGNYSYTVPIKISEVKLNTSYTGNIDFTNDVVYTDNIKANSFSRTISQTIKTAASFKHFESEVAVNYMTAFNHYNVGQGLSNNVHRWIFSLNEKVTFDQNTSLNIDATKSLNYGYANINSSNPFVVNTTVMRSFFKQSLMINIQATDILNQANKINQVTIGNSVINNRTNYITRFFILGVSYKISKFGHLK